MRRLRAAAAAVAAALLLGSCSPQADSVEDLRRRVRDLGESSAPPFDRYVALGDSFTAAPLVPTTDLANGCFRSDSNYPSLLTERLDIPELVDVSCSGATTSDLTGRQRTVRRQTVRPQLDAVTPETDLVTLGIGGNDFDLFHTLVSTCSQLRAADPSGNPCERTLRARGLDLVSEAHEIGDRVATAVRRIRDRAPEARIVVVGYLRLAPSSGTCAQLPFARGDYPFGDRVSRALDAGLERAARRTHVAFLDMHALSKGHDVCSDDPWVNGDRTVEGEALAYHPFEEGMEAVADELVAMLS